MEQCQGVKGNNGDCCHIRDKDWIIGPVKDDKELLTRVQKEHDKDLTWSDLFIDYEEGKKMFSDKSLWQDKKSYPVMRVNPELEGSPCVFFDNGCKIHEIKSDVCKNYKCQWLWSKEVKDKFAYVTTEAQDQTLIGIKEGKFAGVVYKYGKVSFGEKEDENGNLPMKFHYDIVDNNEIPREQFGEDFFTLIGDILVEVIEEQANNEPVDRKNSSK
jgi:Fe-S-cluster containining protein